MMKLSSSASSQCVLNRQFITGGILFIAFLSYGNAYIIWNSSNMNSDFPDGKNFCCNQFILRNLKKQKIAMNLLANLM